MSTFANDVDRRPDDPCPKRLWVMMELADDEGREQVSAPATGLRFHLSRCPSCRRLADELRRTAEKLSTLARIEPPADLFAKAQAQAMHALQQGAVSRYPDEIGEGQTAARIPPRQARSVRWIRGVGALAASLALVTTGWLAHAWYVGPRPPATSSNFSQWYIPSEELAPAAASADDPVNSEEGTSSDEAWVRVDDAGNVRLCRFRSHDEAALNEDPACIPAAMVLPGPPPRRARPDAVFDNSTRTLSTGPASERR